MKNKRSESLSLNKKSISTLQENIVGGIHNNSGTCQSLNNCTWSGGWTCHNSCQGSCCDCDEK